MPLSAYTALDDMSDGPRHLPVLQTVVLDMLCPRPGETVLDCTLGLGGHALRFADAVGSEGSLIGLETDSRNLALAKDRLKGKGNADLRHATFADLQRLGLPAVDIVFADLGLSSPHIDDPARGFSFRAEGPLDLRFDATKGEPASALVARSSPEMLVEIFRSYGEFPGVYRLAAALAGREMRTTTELRDAVEKSLGFKAKVLLPQVFQALRIAVNDEIGALEALLEHGPKLLRPGGRMGIISYHSLEDRPVKRAFRSLTTPSRDPVTGKARSDAAFRLLTPRAVIPSAAEVSENPRARSAKFRAIERLPSTPS